MRPRRAGERRGHPARRGEPVRRVRRDAPEPPPRRLRVLRVHGRLVPVRGEDRPRPPVRHRRPVRLRRPHRRGRRPVQRERRAGRQRRGPRPRRRRPRRAARREGRRGVDARRRRRRRAQARLASRLGATHTVAGGPDAVDAIKDLTDGGAEKVIDTTGVVPVLQQAYAATRPGGTTVTVGLPDPGKPVELPALSLVAEERTLKGSYLGSCVPRRDVPRFIGMYRNGNLPVDALLSGRLALDDVNAGFDRLHGGEAVRQVITFG
ncbi:zinc-binding dehydrogenase [Actinomadura sp. CNU-125]|uniref:zinc-binding dehydrogenase n=1 Tax=Actinomadura sp. CNU-125 TaxID=1904961 RepID=UPI0021CC9333|nr:zinc-binding dehydrogenase [Actinomadura sp. CNU-125]